MTDQPPPDVKVTLRGRFVVSGDDMERAVGSGLITGPQAEQLWLFLTRESSERPRFDGVHVAYYAGALLVIAAMGWLLTTAWENAGGIGLAALGFAYGAAFWMAGDSLWKRGLRVPGGLLCTMAVCMTPLVVYGIERELGMWPQGDPGQYQDYYRYVRGSWILIEIGTIVVGALAIWRRPFAFLTAPIAFALWFMSMDLAPLVFGLPDSLTYQQRAWVSAWFGLAILLASYLADLRNRLREDFAFWGYLFGLLAFWGGLSMMNSDSELSRLLYCLINVALIVLSVLLRQRAFVVFGTIGVLEYLGHLSYQVFKDSLLFPIVLVLIGIGLIYLGVLYQRHSARIVQGVQAALPDAVRNLIPLRARRA